MLEPQAAQLASSRLSTPEGRWHVAPQTLQMNCADPEHVKRGPPGEHRYFSGSSPA